MLDLFGGLTAMRFFAESVNLTQPGKDWFKLGMLWDANTHSD